MKAALLKRQEYKCMICDIPLDMSGAVVDHDHKTGLIRDALCRNCNGLEGKIYNVATRGRRHMDRPLYLARVIKYWLRHAEPKTTFYHPTHKSTDEKRLLQNKKARIARQLKKAKR